jgi:hypothetical protein
MRRFKREKDARRCQALNLLCAMGRMRSVVMLKSRISLVALVGMNLLGTQALATEVIWPTIPFVAGADHCNAYQVGGQSRVETRQELIGEMVRLMKAGARAPDAMNAVLAFDRLYDQHRSDAVKQLDVSLEALLHGYLDQFYEYYRPREKRLEFRAVNEANEIINAAKYWQRAGNIPKEGLEQLDYFAIGTFSHQQGCYGKVDVSLDLISTRNGKVRSFLGTGTPQEATFEVVKKLFDSFQRAHFPSSLSGLDGRKVTILGTPSGRPTDKVDWETAAMACRSMGGRLPSAQEVKLVNMYGDYSGGITLQLHGNYSLNQPGQVYVSDFVGQEVREFRMINDKTAFFFCLK